MNTERMLNVTNVDLKLFVKTVYSLSVPLGMGMLHYTEGDLTDKEAEKLLEVDDSVFGRDTTRFGVSLDYVKGRACKMTVHKHDGKLWIDNSWYDHTPKQLAQLREVCGF